MASYRKHRNGWRVEVCVNGRRKSYVCDTKARAQEWAAHTVKTLHGWTDAGDHTLGDAFKKYSEEVSPNKKGCRWEQIRLKRLQAATIADLRMDALTPSHLAEWRDKLMPSLCLP